MIAFVNFCPIGNRNEHSTKQVQTVSLQPYYVSILPGKTKNSIKTADRLLQCVLFNQLFQTFAESVSVGAKIIKSRPRNARVIVENKLVRFLTKHGIYSDLSMFFNCMFISAKLLTRYV